MEVICNVVSQGTLESREWVNPNTNEKKQITSLPVTLKRGRDVIVTEATGDLAVTLSNNPLSSDVPAYVANIRFNLSKPRDNGKVFNNVRLDSIDKL